MLFSQFWRLKDQKYFVYILGFIFYGISSLKTDLNNKCTI